MTTVYDPWANPTDPANAALVVALQQRVAALETALDDVLEALTAMTADRCTMGDGTLDAMHSGSSCDAIRTLARHDRATLITDNRHNTTARWNHQ